MPEPARRIRLDGKGRARADDRHARVVAGNRRDLAAVDETVEQERPGRHRRRVHDGESARSDGGVRSVEGAETVEADDEAVTRFRHPVGARVGELAAAHVHVRGVEVDAALDRVRARIDDHEVVAQVEGGGGGREVRLEAAEEHAARTDRHGVVGVRVEGRAEGVGGAGAGPGLAQDLSARYRDSHEGGAPPVDEGEHVAVERCGRKHHVAAQGRGEHGRRRVGGDPGLGDTVPVRVEQGDGRRDEVAGHDGEGGIGGEGLQGRLVAGRARCAAGRGEGRDEGADAERAGGGTAGTTPATRPRCDAIPTI